MEMDKRLEERTNAEGEILLKLERELSKAISVVLRRYGIGGPYIFNVRREQDYGHNPIMRIRGKELTNPMWCIGSGGATVENPEEVYPI